MSRLTPLVVTSLFLCTSAAAQDWLPMVHDGFGNPATASVTRIVRFGSETDFYVGTVEMDGGGRLMHSSDSGWHWSPATAPGFGNPDNNGIFLGAVFNGMLYASTSNFMGGGELWRTADGANWTQVVAQGFGDPMTISLFPTVVCANRLFVATNRFGAGAQLWRSEDGSHWNQAGTDGMGDPGVFALFGPVEFQGKLYVSAASDFNPARVYRSTNGNVWQPVGAPGFGDPETSIIRPTVVFQDQLYAGSTSMFGGPGQLWRTHDGVQWTSVTHDGFNNPFNENVSAGAVFNGELYVACNNSTEGASVLRSQDGVHFQSASACAFGWPGNLSINFGPEIEGELCASTFNFETGAQLWLLQPQTEIGNAYCSSTPNSSGVAATIRAVGDVNLSGTGFRLDVQGCPPRTPGLFFYGPSQISMPLGNGLLCVGGPLKRIPGPLVTDADGRASRFIAYDQSFAAGILPGGSGIDYQLWFRDPIPGAVGGSNLSNALSIVHTP